MTTHTPSQVRRRIVVRGSVQGVGFRPFVYREATARGLAGWVRNSNAGVIVEAEGDAQRVADLVEAIGRSHPRHARITGLTIDDVAPACASGFAIVTSCADDDGGAEVLPDLATCNACLAELFDPTDRRYRYPFLSCTECGPRASIVEALPYDRSNTSMRRFQMCIECRAEYDDPADRRFHAEPNACPNCGPRLALWDASGAVLASDDAALARSVAAIAGGGIVAVKGIGGFHLIVDAGNDDAVRLLRARKRRAQKPFAVMFPDLAQIEACCRLSEGATELLSSAARPIVLLPRRADTKAMAPSVAPNLARLGVLLPYAPLHHLLLGSLGAPVVATSGNVSDEPIVTDEHEALARLAGIADLLLVHDRPIVRPLDDSVLQINCGRPQVLRRARGYGAPIASEGTAAGIVGVGGYLKTTVALSGADTVIASQHIGDLDTMAGRAAHTAALDDLLRVHPTQPRLVVHDLHPDYASSHTARSWGTPTLAVQHHVAHVAACLAEHHLTPPALGVAWDGSGYGPDGTVWGGEFLRVSRRGWQRVAALRPFRLPGGDAAVREPRRAALGLLYGAFGEGCLTMTDLPSLAAFEPDEAAVLLRALARGVNAPLASSVGRFFDAVASLCGLLQRSCYEGQAATALEWTGGGVTSSRGYELPLQVGGDEGAPWLIDWQPCVEAVCAELRAGVEVGRIAAALHRGLANAVVAVAELIGERRVALTGGCFQNVHLTEATVARLAAAGFEPVWHTSIPPNDGGIAVGQVVWAGWQEQQGDDVCV